MIKHALLLMLVILSAHLIPFEDAYPAKPLIIFDKSAYGPFATAKILIVEPGSNNDREQIDTIQAVVYTKSNVGNVFQFTEVAPDAGVFEALVRLTPDQNEWPGDLVVQKGDQLFVEFSSEDGTSTSSASIDFATSLVMFGKAQYTLDEEVKILVLDIEENKIPSAIDTVEAMVWSTADIKGLKLTLREVGINMGVFTGTLSLVKDQLSSGNVLKVSPNDVITAKYTDKTLPPPAKTGEPQQVKDLFAAALVTQKKGQPIEVTPPSKPEIVDQMGNIVSDVKLGQVIIIQDNVVNNQETTQKFAYIVLIKDRDGITVSLSWLTGELPPLSTFKAGQSWVPEQAGEYDIALFLWQSIDNPVILAPQKSITITVTHPLE